MRAKPITESPSQIRGSEHAAMSKVRAIIEKRLCVIM